MSEDQHEPGKLQQRFDRLSGMLNWLAGTSVFAMMLLVVADVGGRFLFTAPVIGTLEATEQLMVFAVFLALAYTQRLNMHVRVDMLASRFGTSTRTAVNLVALCLFLVMLALVAWQSGLAAWASWEVREVNSGVVRLPLYPAKFAVALGSALLCLQILFDLAGCLKQGEKKVEVI